MSSENSTVLQGFEETSWYEALDLGERCTDLRRHAIASEERFGAAFDRQRAERRAARWRAQSPFSEDGTFARRLAAAGIDEAMLLRLLGEPSKQLAERHERPLPWLQQIVRAYHRPRTDDRLVWPRRQGASEDSYLFLALVEPLAEAGLARLRQIVEELNEQRGMVFLDPAKTDKLLLTLVVERLRGLLLRPLVLELQITKLEERLAGDTPGERFRSFVDSLRQPQQAIEILSSYPVLARKLVQRIDQWVAVCGEFLSRLSDDLQAIRQGFGWRDDPGPLVELDGSVSDPHRGGRGVYKLRFASGRRLIYKPKPLAVDVAFQNLLRWLDERDSTPRLRPLAVLDRGDYGWVEHIDAAPCASVAEVRRFYQRQGAYLALLYLLEGTDVHQENLIAMGEHPMLVDLETLFHPRVFVAELRDQERLLGAAVGDSVTRIGLLPNRVWSDDEHEGVEMSGLGSAAGQTTKPFWQAIDEGTDEMRFELRSATLSGAENQPTLAGDSVQPWAHVDDIAAGFASLYQLLSEQRDELLSAAGPLAAFADVAVRVVFRPTRAYALLLLESYHPHFLGNALDRVRFLDQLWAAALERPFMERLIAAEQRDLERGDIPLFTTRPNSRDLWTSDGERLADFFETIGQERLGRRLQRFSRGDLERQLWLIRGSLTAFRLESEEGAHGHAYTLRSATAAATSEELLAAASAVGERFAQLAFRDPGYAQWAHVQPLGGRRWAQRMAHPDLYLGLPGIALFLAHLGALSDAPETTRLARAAVATQRRQLAEAPGLVVGIGGFNGWGGVIYALTRLAVLWHDGELLAEAEALVERLPPLIAADEHHDLVAGTAGCLTALLGLHQARPSAAVWQVILQCGEHLLHSARDMEVGRAWVMRVAGPRPLAGLSHGVAGIALALLRLWGASGDERFRAAAVAGLAYERSLYSAQHRNWPDLRADASEREQLHGGAEPYMCSWCHGAPGVGLARVAGLGYLDDSEVRAEIGVAVATTLAEGLGRNHSLCHGDLGNLDFLLAAARATGDEKLRREVYRRAAGVLRSIDEHGWLCGLPIGVEPMGLMVGLAGIGYGLLRLARPEALPSVLTLAYEAGAAGGDST